MAVALLGGCGGGSNRLSAKDYRSRLATIGQEANKAQADVEKGLHATSVADLGGILENFADADQRLGDEVSALKPPKDAEAANAELAQGEHDLADEARSAAVALANIKTPKAALALLNTRLQGAKGAQELDHGLTELKKKGYTKGG